MESVIFLLTFGRKTQPGITGRGPGRTIVPLPQLPASFPFAKPKRKPAGLGASVMLSVRTVSLSGPIILLGPCGP